MRDGSCVPFRFPLPSDSLKVEIGNDTQVDDRLPDGVKQTGFVRLDNSTVMPTDRISRDLKRGYRVIFNGDIA